MEARLLACLDDARGVWKSLQQWEAHRRKDKGRRYCPEFALIYFAQDPLTRFIKIGRANNPIQRRRVQGSGSASNCVLTRVMAERPGVKESDLHRRFTDWRVPGRHEWYRPMPELTALAGATPGKVLWDPVDLFRAIRWIESLAARGTLWLPGTTIILGPDGRPLRRPQLGGAGDGESS